MSKITHALIGTDNFSYEHYIQGFYSSYEAAESARSSIPPNGTLPDTYEVMTLEAANALYRRSDEAWYFDQMLAEAQPS